MRPITDTWLLARSKVKYYGSFPSGFLERARILLGATINETVWHLCGGMVKSYPGKRGIGPNDVTFDIRPECKPDYLCDVREMFNALGDHVAVGSLVNRMKQPRAILIDRPYTLEDAEHYGTSSVLPNINLLTTQAVAYMGGLKVGVLDYVCPSPKKAREVALVHVIAGVNNRSRVFTVWEAE